jgi:hypothetical protein
MDACEFKKINVIITEAKIAPEVSIFKKGVKSPFVKELTFLVMPSII